MMMTVMIMTIMIIKMMLNYNHDVDEDHLIPDWPSPSLIMIIMTIIMIMI